MILSEKSLNQYKHLIALDLTSYGAAFAIINRFVDDDGIKVFEVSPCGQTAILILLAKEITSAQILISEIASFFKDQVLNIALIENAHTDLLPTYLSQNKTSLNKNLLILEGSSVALGLHLADKLLKQKYALVDFRVIRTFPKNVIISATTASMTELLDIDCANFKKNYIEEVQISLKSFYEI